MPDGSGGRDPERGPREAVERPLEQPRGGGGEGELLRDAPVVPFEPALSPVQHRDGGVGGERAAHEAFVHAVAGDRVDEAGRVADHARPAAADHRALAAQRQAVPAQLHDGAEGQPETLAEGAKLAAEARALVLPAADADVDVVALREDPAVAAFESPELEQHAALHVEVRCQLERHVALERHADGRVAAEGERPRARPVGAVRTDDEGRPHLSAAHVGCGAARVGDDGGHLAAERERRAGGLGRLDEVVVEADPLRHVCDRMLRRARHASPVRLPEVGVVDDAFDDCVDRARGDGRRPAGDAAAAWLVARELGAVGEQHAGPRCGQADRCGGAGGAGAHHEDVVRHGVSFPDPGTPNHALGACAHTGW